MAVYIEIDSKCPETDERFAFLANKKFKVKTMKLGKFKVISQGLALPLSLFPELQDKKIGDDVTETLKITYASEEDVARKTNKIDPNAKYKSMAKRRPKLFANPIVRRIMRYSIGRKIMFMLFGRKNKYMRRHYKYLRKKLGKAKKLDTIKRINDKEQRIMKDIDHKLSHDIIETAVVHNVKVIKLEQLQNIRSTTRPSRKTILVCIHGHSIDLHSL